MIFFFFFFQFLRALKQHVDYFGAFNCSALNGASIRNFKLWLKIKATKTSKKVIDFITQKQRSDKKTKNSVWRTKITVTQGTPWPKVPKFPYLSVPSRIITRDATEFVTEKKLTKRVEMWKPT